MHLTSRARRTIALAVVPTAVLASGLVIAQASYAAFSATTSNAPNTWSAGSVSLSDDDSDTALFTASGLQPGDTRTSCIVVTSTGSLPSTVKLYGTDPATTNALSSSLHVTVTEGTGGSFGKCSGFTPLSPAAVWSGSLADLGSTATRFSNGIGTWRTAGGSSESRTYQVTVALDAATPNSAQNGTARIGLTWEAQSS
ncbi:MULTISPECIES: hypothetical protein [unclassified Curtobacterium]|uniref:hypothetical protein n=1 Tax=unclassified Curtobacterium TaxID=257496 RepID=UPI00052A1B1A|nr:MULTISPECIES: hypothetical protein [unclassified Curtobacterium]AIV40867.1 hypothetical protein NI26_13505 [Curtobacterium sp. MR_MD2014]MBP1303016.1 hypothetical protein [Curtobacterium sp. 1310]MCM3506482.1 hypothetical protein [Curtobacterium sp. ODYSSEY 48 V2]MCM3522527.1 hypothetical protein [Curtobacterium sp. P97]MDB6427076.1 hypothetical protein [Curtobacterium sp. 20TX0008]